MKAIINSKEQAGNMPSILAAKEWSKTKVSQKRFEHIAGVAKTAVQLAQLFDCDPYLAELAAWLHDACKESKPKDLIQQYRQFGLEPSIVEEANGHILHGPVAAELIRTALGIKNEDVLNAVREHTLGAINMSLLSKVIFLADALEPGRPVDYTQPIWQALSLSGRANIDLAILVTLDLNLQHLLKLRKTIHPKTVEVRNHYLTLVD
jgi:predicted HD superfamily hydrolase involved in NAD metabolism